MTPEMRNRLGRYLDMIEANAKLATPGPWSISHGHVIKHGTMPDGSHVSFDIASMPYARDQCVFGINPQSTSCLPNDMRHIATCHPKVMINLVGLVRELLAELTA